MVCRHDGVRDAKNLYVSGDVCMRVLLRRSSARCLGLLRLREQTVAWLLWCVVNVVALVGATRLVVARVLIPVIPMVDYMSFGCSGAN